MSVARGVLGSLLLCLLGAAVALAQPVGPEFRVNTYTFDEQSQASVAADSSGNLVVVWNSDGQDGSSRGVFGQRYASTGAPLGAEFRVNTFTTGTQFGRAVASDPSGNFVVVWQSDFQAGSHYEIFGQRYASSGAPLGPEFHVNTQTGGYALKPAVASDSSGKFIVVWYAPDGSSYGIFGQRYNTIALGPSWWPPTDPVE